MYSSGVRALPVYAVLLITSAARVLTPASEGPTICAFGWVEWQLKQAGGVFPKSASPSATGSLEAAPGGFVPSMMPCGVAALTRIGLGGQLLLSMFETHARNAITFVMSSSDRFGFGISRPCCSSE